MPPLKRTVTPAQAQARLEELCAKAERCTWELRRKLILWQIAPADAESIMEGLMRHRFVDDARFARSVVHDKVAFERRGRLYLRQYLAARRIPSATIADALAEIDEDAYRENIKHVLQCRLHSKSDLAETFEGRTKVFRYGVSRGYEPGLVSETLKALLVK